MEDYDIQSSLGNSSIPLNSNALQNSNGSIHIQVLGSFRLDVGQIKTLPLILHPCVNSFNNHLGWPMVLPLTKNSVPDFIGLNQSPSYGPFPASLSLGFSMVAS